MRGQIRPIPELSASDLIRFWSRVDITDAESCWHWLGGTNKDGYGVMGIGYLVYLVSRIMFFLHYKRQPTKFVLHACDNPRCCSPYHLFEGTCKDNMIDKALKDRSGTSKLTQNEYNEIRKLGSTLTQVEIARKFGVERSIVGRILNRRTCR